MILELYNLEVGNYSFSVAAPGDGHIYIGLDDLLFATLIDDYLAKQIRALKSPPRGYSSLIIIKDFYENISDGEDHTYLLKTEFVEIHSAIALMRLALQERPENKTVLALIEAFKKEFGLGEGDMGIVDYILNTPWVNPITRKS